MATPREALNSIGADCRVYQRLSVRRAASVVEAAFTPSDQRKPRQEREIFDLKAHKASKTC